MFFEKSQSPRATCFVAIFFDSYGMDADEILEFFNGEHNYLIKYKFEASGDFINDSLSDACYYIKGCGGPERSMRYIFEVGCSAKDFCQLLRNDSESFHRLFRCAYNADDVIEAVRQVPGNRYRSIHKKYFPKVNLTSKSIERHVNPNYSRIVAKLTQKWEETSSRWSSCRIS